MPGSLLPILFTAAAAALVAVFLFAVLRFLAATRAAQRRLKDTGSETTMLSSALQDAVGKLKAQEQLMRTRAHTSEALSARIVDSLTAGLMVVDAEGRLHTVNPAARAMLGVDDTVLGRSYVDVLAPVPALCDLVAQCMAGSPAEGPADIVMRSSEAARHLTVTLSALAAEPAAPQGLVCLMTDVTVLRELEEQLHLKDALARLGELTAGIAHEFRNGLATIHGYSRLLRPDQLPEAFRPYVDGIRQESESLGQVMTRFLEYARPAARSFAPVDLGAVARRAVADLGTELPVAADVRVEGEFAPILGDEVVLRQVFGNLIRNGVESCQSALVPSPTVRIIGSVDGRHCRVSVDDNGPGIPESARGRVFEPFFTTRSRGTGLGLAVVQKVVVTHNGRVGAGESASGGASIQMTFPVAPGVADSSAA